MEKFGKTDTEIEASKILECRNIVKNIIRFGVSEQQKLQLIKLLALELDSRDSMKKIVDLIKSISENEGVQLSLNTSENNQNTPKPKLLDV